MLWSWEPWIPPATGLQAGFLGADNISFCPHLSTSGAFWFSTRRRKHQQKPIIISPFVFADYLSLVEFSPLSFLYVLCATLGGGGNPEAILWLIGSVSWFFENEWPFLKKTYFLSSKNKITPPKHFPLDLNKDPPRVPSDGSSLRGQVDQRPAGFLCRVTS